jgi:hypothetical protein
VCDPPAACHVVCDHSKSATVALSPGASNDRRGRKVEDDPNEAAGNDQTHNRTNPKEARSKKSMITVEDDTNMKMMVEL